MEPFRLYIVLLLLCRITGAAQVPAARALALRQAYENRAAHDSMGRRHVQELIALARQHDDPAELSQTLRDAITFEADPATKLEYATGAVRAAVHSGDPRLIAAAQLTRGTIFAFDLRELRPALDAFLEAYAAARESGDGYEQHKLLYFIGLMVRYRGDHATAADYFSRCVSYFRAARQRPLHPNEYYNYSRGYYNSLYQMISCLQETGENQLADCYLQEARRDFQRRGRPPEYAAFVLCEAVSAYRRDDYTSSIALLGQVLQERPGAEETAKACRYLALNYRRTGECAAARHYLLRIDSAYAATGEVHEDLPAAYALLLSEAPTAETAAEQDWYRQQRRRATTQLAAQQQALAQRFNQQLSGPGSFTWEHGPAIFALLLAGLAGIFSWQQQRYRQVPAQPAQKDQRKRVRRRRKRAEAAVSEGAGTDDCRSLPAFCSKAVRPAPAGTVQDGRSPYCSATGIKAGAASDLSAQIPDAVVVPPETVENSVGLDHAQGPPQETRGLSDQQPAAEICERLLVQLEEFENTHGYLRQNVRLPQLARKFRTNAKYLSHCIRAHRGQDFKPYIAGLRLDYAAARLARDPLWLRLSVKAIAHDCGFGSRSHFSDSFLRRFGLRPYQYMEACRRGAPPVLMTKGTAKSVSNSLKDRSD